MDQCGHEPNHDKLIKIRMKPVDVKVTDIGAGMILRFTDARGRTVERVLTMEQADDMLAQLERCMAERTKERRLQAAATFKRRVRAIDKARKNPK